MSLLPKLQFDGENIATIPNFLTLGRFGITGYVAYILAMDGPSMHAGYWYAGGAMTDFLDGKIARTFPGQATNFGKRLDPLADSFAFHAPLWALGIHTPHTIDAAIYLGSSTLIALRDSLLFRKGIELEKYGEIFEVTKLGKLKTAVSMLAISILVATPEGYVFQSHGGGILSVQELLEDMVTRAGITVSDDIQKVGKWLLSMGTAASLVTLVDYWNKIKCKLIQIKRKTC